MKKIISHVVLLTFVFISNQSIAQLKDDDYRKQAEEVRNYVWSQKIKEFDVRDIPAEYSKYSKVIIAKHEEITGLAKSRVKSISLFGVQMKKNLTYTHTTRELVKINDAAALEDFSEISFQKYAQQYRNKFTTYLGVRVIKPDGSVKEINPDEVILTDNTDKNKKGKLAVPDLQIGDMIDYFIQTVEFYDDGGSLDFENFVFADENPIMHYSVHVEANKKLAVVYRPMNGAPDFKLSQNEDEDNVMDAQQNNIAPFPTNLWMSPYRQIPLLRFHMVLGNSTYKAGELYKNPDTDPIVESYNSVIKSYVSSARTSLGYFDKPVKKAAQSYLDQNGGGELRDNPLAIYYAARHQFLLNFSKDDVSVVNNRRNYNSPDAVIFLSILEELFAQYKINSQFVLLPSKYGPKFNEIMSLGDLQPALMTDDGQIFTCESIFDAPNVIPQYLEGQQGVTIDYHFSFRQAKSDKGSYSTKYSPATQNQHTEDLVFTFNPSDPQKIKVDRKATVTGLLRLDYQQKLLLYEDLYEYERTALGQKNSFNDELQDSKKGRKIVEEYQHAFDEARKEWKENCKDEINDQFNVKPEEVLSVKIDQPGVFDNKRSMIFTEQFTVNAWVKKAGNNYILDAGKMIGEQLEIKPEQRDRKVDVYMPHARILQYNVSIPVPQGYTAEGLDKLNTNIDNATGSFVTTAKLDGSNVKLTITKVYKNAFEKAEQWPDLLKMLDAATAFEEMKIMFKKS